MKKTPLYSALLLLTFLSFASGVNAQNDTTSIDAGQLVLNKKLTQGIRIKGEDLEKMPFSNLADALSAWAYGVYTLPENIIYVVDGNPLADANAYSVHDIEEVLIVQNATVEMNTAPGQQFIALVTTRRKVRPGTGLEFAGQSSLMWQPSSRNGLFDKAYAGITRIAGKFDFGGSFEYLHDLMPPTTGTLISTTTPFNIDRQRLNSWARWRADAHNIVELSANFTWQGIDSSRATPYGTYITDGNVHQQQNLFTPRLRWHGNWGGLTHELQAGYLASLTTSHSFSAGYPHEQPSQVSTMAMATKAHTDHMFFRERIGYRIAAGAWTLEPAVNASYEHVVDRKDLGYVVDGGNTGASSSWQKGHIWLLTPSLDIRYKDVFDLQGGVLANVTGKPAGAGDTKLNRVFPFASLGADVLRLINVKSPSSLKLFGSYSKRTAWSVNDYTLNDLKTMDNPIASVPTLATVYTGNGIYSGFGFPQIPTFWSWHTGVTYSAANDRLQISYAFERRNEFNYIAFTSPGGFVYETLNWTSAMHYAAIDGKILAGSNLQWRSGLHASIWSNKLAANNLNVSLYTLKPTGDYLSDNGITSVTGGWVNRIDVKAFSFGLDLVYHINEAVPNDLTTSPIQYHKENYFCVQNLYAALRLPMADGKKLEVFISTRGIPQNDKGTVTDRRRFFGVGGKLAL